MSILFPQWGKKGIFPETGGIFYPKKRRRELYVTSPGLELHSLRMENEMTPFIEESKTYSQLRKTLKKTTFSCTEREGSTSFPSRENMFLFFRDRKRHPFTFQKLFVPIFSKIGE